MTFNRHVPLRLGIAALAMALPALACAWQSAPPPRPVIVVQPPPDARFQQTMREQQVHDQLQKSQLEEQLRQSQADTARKPFASTPVRAVRPDQTDQAQRDLYRARQQDLLDRYQNAVAPPVVHSQSAPAAAHSSG